MARLRKNLLGNSYLTGANLVGQFCLVPLYLHFWGAETYGTWLVLFTIPAFFVFTDAGLANTVGNAVSLSLESGRTKEAQSQLNAAWKFQALIWGVVFSGLCLCLWILPIQSWLGVTTLPQAELRATVILLSLCTFVWLQAGILSAIYRGARMYHVYLTWRAHAGVAEGLFIGLVLVLGGRFTAVAGTMLGVRFIVMLVLFIRGRVILPAVRPAIFSGRWSDIIPMLPSGLSFLSFPVANALINQGTILAVSRLLGAPTVVILSVCRQLARLFTQGTSVMLGALHPEMTIALGCEDRSRVRDLQTLAAMVPTLVAIPFLLGVWLFGPTLIELWTRKHLGVTNWLTLSCAAEAIAFGSMNLFSLVPWAVSRVRRLSALYAALNISALGVGAALSHWVGIVAYPLSFALGHLLYCVIGIRLGASIGGFRIREVFSVRAALVLLRERLRRVGRSNKVASRTEDTSVRNAG